MHILSSNEILAVHGGDSFQYAKIYIDIIDAPIDLLPVLAQIAKDCVKNNWNAEQLTTALNNSGIDPKFINVTTFYDF